MPYLLHQLLEISAKQYPDRKAVIYNNNSITYQELNEVSTRLSCVLRNAGVEKGDRIGIYLNKSIEAVSAIFGILKAGAVYVPLDPSAPVRRIASIINDCRIEVLISTPKKIASLEQILPKLAPIRRAIAVGGDAFQISGTINNFISWQDVLQAPLFPLPVNEEVFAVNDRGEIATVGEVGELYVRGRSLMDGYWGHSDLTEEVLVSRSCNMSSQSAEGEQKQDLVYKTGDLVRQEPDGNYIFLGRRDRTIKSRGYRIDLGEIETTLYKHPQVAEVAVVAISDEQFGHIVKAVVVPHDIQSLQKQDLASFCSDYLPKYMVPAVIEIRASLPKTSSGKVDLKLL